MSIAFFDFDKTLISSNSATLVIKELWRTGRLSSSHFFHALIWLTQYGMGRTSLDGQMERTLEFMRGYDIDTLQKETTEFYHRQLKQLYRPGAQAVIDKHRSLGDQLVLLTSIPMVLAGIVEQDLGFDAKLCTQFELDKKGILTGKIQKPMCFGEGKRSMLMDFLSQARVSPDRCTFYSDSYSDVPALLEVGTPIAVNPDFRLRRFAKRQNWPILDWGKAR